MKVPKVNEEIELKDDLIKSKITLPGGKLPLHPLALQFWTHNFTNIPDFRSRDILIFIIIWLVNMAMMRFVYGRIKAFMVLRLYMDGHVEDLKYHTLNDAGYCYFQF